jgi:hypothetical protein
MATKRKRQSRKKNEKRARASVVSRKKLAKKKAAPARKSSRKKKSAPKKRGFLGKAQAVDSVVFQPRGLGARSGGQSGDLQGLSGGEGAASESVEELLEEGNAFEAEMVKGVEDAGDSDEGEVVSHEVPEDDVPEEYLPEK